MIVKLLTEHHLEFLSLEGGCLGSSESTHVKMSHCLKSHALAQMCELANVFKLSCAKPFMHMSILRSYYDEQHSVF